MYQGRIQCFLWVISRYIYAWHLFFFMHYSGPLKEVCLCGWGGGGGSGWYLDPPLTDAFMVI